MLAEASLQELEVMSIILCALEDSIEFHHVYVPGKGRHDAGP